LIKRKEVRKMKIVELSLITEKTGEKAQKVNEIVTNIEAKYSETSLPEGQGLQFNFNEVGLEDDAPWVILGWVRSKLQKKGHKVHISRKARTITVA